MSMSTSSAKSPLIESSQTEPHKNLAKLINKYQQTKMQDSIPKHAYDAFEIANEFVNKEAVVLDSGCGVGESSYHLAKQFPNMKVVAIDKSVARLQRSHNHGECPDNLLLLQADCIHLWRLIQQANWPVKRHYLLYPNPWPKPGHLQRRWHGHPVFPTLISLAGVLTMRTNWLIYVQEFAQAIELITHVSVEIEELQLESAMTPFERKYMKSEHKLYQVQVQLDA